MYKIAVCSNHDQRAHAPRVRQHVLCAVWNHQSCSEYSLASICSSLLTQIPIKSSIIGPSVIQAIINDTRNNWMGFPFLFAVCAAAMIAIGFVNIEKGREDCRRFTEQRKVDRVVAESGLSPEAISKGKLPVGNDVVVTAEGPSSS